MAERRIVNGWIYERDDSGQIVPIAPAGGGGAQPPADPTFQYKGEGARLDNQSTAAGIRKTDNEIRNDGLRVQSDILHRGQKIDPGGNVVDDPNHRPDAPALTAEVRKQGIDQWNAAMQLDQTIKSMRGAFARGPGATSGFAGLKDYLPFEENQQFDNYGNRLRGIVRNATGLTGGENNTAAETRLNIGGYIPQSSDRDGAIVDKFVELEAMRDKARRQAIQTLGGIPDANGNIQPVTGQNAMLEPYLTRGDPLRAAGSGASSTNTPIPPEMQREYDQYMARNIRSLDPDDYVRERNELDRRYGFPQTPENDAAYREYAVSAARRGQQGGTINTTIPGATRKLSALEQFRNDVVSNPAGAAVAGFANAGGFGIPQMLAGDQYDAMSRENPIPTMLGEMGGGIGATGALGSLGAATLGRSARLTAAPRFAKNLAGDVAYGGIYGGTTEGDPLDGLLSGAIGSTIGQSGSKLLGGAVGGISNEAIRELQARGIPMTVGQVAGTTDSTAGRFIKGLEDRATSYIGVGDTIGSRRAEGIQALNRAAFDEVLAPIGGKAREIGERGVEQAQEAIGDFYAKALGHRRIPLDEEYAASMVMLRRELRALPNIGETADFALGKALNNIQDGQLTGRGYQAAIQRLQKASFDIRKVDPIVGADAANLLRQAMQTIDGAALRNGPPEIVGDLQRGNEAWRHLAVVEDSVVRARNGGRTGEEGVFAPSQLTDSSVAGAKRYGGGQGTTERPFFDLSRAGQALASDISSSGTAERLAPLALPTIGGMAGGAGWLPGDEDGGSFQDGAEGTAYGLALTAALMGGGSRPMQDIMVRGLTARAPRLQEAAKEIERRQRLFGSSLVPLLVGGGE